MNLMLTTVGAMAAVAKVAYDCADHFEVFNRKAKGEAETRSVEVAENQSADVGFLLSRIPVFHGSEYEIWSSMMKSLFVSQDLWDMVDRGYIEEELTVEVLREVRKRDATALLFIQQAIGKSVFSCIAGANKSKEAWDALQKKYQGDVKELNRQNSVGESSVLSCPADAIERREAWNVEMESRGYTDEPNQKKAVDELVLSYAAVATDPEDDWPWDAPEQGFKEWCSENPDSGCGGGRDDSDWHFKMNHSNNSTPVAESSFHSKLKLSEDRIGKESGDIKNNNCGSKKGSRGISNRGGRGGRGGKNCGHFNNNQGGRGGQGRGHINNNRGGRGGKGRGHIDNKRGGHRGHSNNNQGGRGRGGLDDGCFSSNKGHSGGIDNGHFNNGSEATDYNSKNAKSESASSCTTNATETKEALDAHALQQGLQANTQVHAQPQAGNPNGGEGQYLTTLLVCDLDVSVTDLQLLGIFIPYGQVVSSSLFRDVATHCSLGYGYVTYGNPQDADRALKELNFTFLNGKPIQIMYFQPDSTEHESGGFNSKKSDYGGTDGGCSDNKDSKLSGYNSKNPNFESVSSWSTNATESREASDATQQGHRANTEVKAHPQVENPSGGSILIENLDEAIDDRALHAIFSAFGNILSCKVETYASGRSKGYGHIEYDSKEAAQEAIEKVNGTLLNHNKVYVGPFVSNQERAKARGMTKVYVANLSESTTKEDLREVFGCLGTIASTVVARDEDGKSKGFGFVDFKDPENASWSIDVLNGHKFDNKKWCVRRFQKKSVKRAKNKSVDESVPSSTANASKSKKAGKAVSEKKIIQKPQNKSVVESVPSSTANETESKKAVEAVQKGYRANTRVLYVDDKGVAHFKLKSP
ncbi:PREDICTED: uncharacterized protein LOC109160086 isoform X2 [Ipomoea nil]|uniref:uncharacterized protein LOC109160086 isoform X2 n=1 Tax=Ipomoea nil TaxID=35883 RepID=UPI0009013D29|nr:PREDICTED: uncharacterized protein LOC109160086 isoform X2 [Ipomoea nil]